MNGKIHSLGWGKFLAIYYIMSGVITLFGIIAIPVGLLMILARLRLMEVVNKLNIYRDDPGIIDPSDIFGSLSGYFKLLGWSTFLSVIVIFEMLVLFWAIVRLFVNVK